MRIQQTRGDIVEKDMLKKQAYAVINEVIEKASLKEGSLLVIGCSSSEVLGDRMGTNSSVEIAEILYDEISGVLRAKNIDLAVQCCEHLNRAIVIEREVAEARGFEPVNVIPQPKAGGSFATAHYKALKEPMVVENIAAKADAGIDIGGVMVGMHIRPVVVPIKLENRHIGEAIILAGRHRPKFIGGERAVYDVQLR